MNKNVTDSWKSQKLNACADSVDQAIFSAPSKEPGYEAIVGDVADQYGCVRSVQSVLFSVHHHMRLTSGYADGGAAQCGQTD